MMRWESEQIAAGVMFDRFNRREVVRMEFIQVLLAAAVIAVAPGCSAWADQGNAVPPNKTGETAPAITEPAPQTGFLERETLTGDWGGGRT
jgi:hypothetical protein